VILPSLTFENCKVPAENLIGEEGEGFIQAMKILEGGRISIAALSVGTCTGLPRCFIKYSNERKQFGNHLTNSRQFNSNWQKWLQILKQQEC
jgi:alkylation response protein AidB-like acyl-CoA dehydrogenase